MVRPSRSAWALCGAALLAAGPVRAQVGLPQASAAPVALRGDMGTTSEAYGISGAAARRPWGTQQLYLNPTISLFGAVDLTVNLLVSTEQGSDVGLRGLPGRQNLNELGLHPRWRWGRGHVGAFSEAYTANTLGGIRLRGAGVELNPGIFRVGAFGGRASNAVFGGLTTGSYARTVVGGRIGLGRDPQQVQRPSFVELIVLRAWDDENSLPDGTDSTAPELPPDLGASPFAVTPQDNLVAAIAGGLRLFGEGLYWKGELDAAVHTRDRRASPLAEQELDGYPGILDGILTPRVGTHGDYAWSTELEVRLGLPGATRQSRRTLQASLGYRYAGPGYVSLGTPITQSDLRRIEARTTLRVGQAAFRLDGWRQRDNVLGQKLATTTRHRLATTLNLQPRRGWTAALNLAYLDMANDATDSLRRVDYANWTLGTTQAWTFGRDARVPNVTLSYAFQRAEDPSSRREGSRLRSHSIDTRTTVRLSARARLTPSLGIQRGLSGSVPWSTRLTWGMGGEWQSPGRDWTLSASFVSARFSAGSDAARASVGARWKLTGADQLSFSAQTGRYSDVPTGDGSFEEYTARLEWSRRF
jgi:hypothetical protein